jgi:hypothetical protein
VENGNPAPGAQSLRAERKEHRMIRSLARQVGTVFEGHPEVTRRRRIHPEKRALLWLNALGGTAVLASYAWNLVAHPEAGGEFWGGVPEAIRPGYVVTMLLAATGYFAFTRFVFRLRPAQVKIGGRLGYGVFKWIYALILVPSALWMPLTFAMIENPGAGLWLGIRLTLAAVGVGSLLLMAALLRIEPRSPERSHRLAVAGSVAFAFQTAILDALVWPAFFPV